MLQGDGVSRSSARPGVSVPLALLDAYRAAGVAVPPLSGLLARAMREALEQAGVSVGGLEQAGTGAARVARATAARWPRGGRGAGGPGAGP